MKIKVLCLGKLKEKALLDLQQEYLLRLKGSQEILITEIDSSKYSKLSESELKKREADLMLEKLESSDLLVALDEKGKELNSHEFAAQFSKWMVSGKKTLVFAIGGAYGWHESVYARADFKLSLSKLTFTYQFARIALIEQIYRGISINKGLPYHK